MSAKRQAPTLESLLAAATRSAGDKPIAFVVAGHNGSGKSTLWTERLAPQLQRPLINADRLIGSILPAPDANGQLVSWAARMRDQDARWQKLAQEGVNAFMALVMQQKMSFAFETVFSHWQVLADGTVSSKIDVLNSLKQNGYFVVLLFVGLANVQISIARVATRKAQGGHDVPIGKLRERFPRTQKAIAAAAPIADMTLMFDNSAGVRQAFRLARVQQRKAILYDCRDSEYKVPKDLLVAAKLWLPLVSAT